jgi:8-oxo-dGTP pyrophosphatase MutT (NUDIX family)
MPLPHPLTLAWAATLILVRQHAGELQVYLLRRSPTSGFMPGLFVFPGGLVDVADGDEDFWKDRQDVDPDTVVERIGRGLNFSDASSYAVAAVRETFEEAGILLASKPGSADENLKLACERRLTNSQQAGWFRTLVDSDGWKLTISALAPWSHWITPVGMPRRFDTRFFVAALPDGQTARPDQRETTAGLWISPRQALADNLVGRTPLSPPTLVTLHEFLKYANLDDLQVSLKWRGWGDPIFPRLLTLGKKAGSVIIEPWDPMYGHGDLRIENKMLPESVLPPEAPFSRLWNDKGVWKPISLLSSLA